MPKPLRVGIIGCGQITHRLHAPDYATCPDTDLVALADISRKQSSKVAESWAPHATLYTRYEDMLKNEELDAVTVTLPNALHAEATVKALRAGCHVLVEKPMATSRAETKRMNDAAKKHKRLLMVNQSQRLYPVHRKAKEVLDSGLLGKVLLVNAMFGHEGPENWSPDSKWFFKEKDAKFGAMADLGVHKADLIRYLTGKEIASVAAFSGRLEKKNSTVEDNFTSALTFKDGTLGTLTASWTTKGMDADYAIFHCANGTLRVNEIPGRPLVAHVAHPECEIDFDIQEPKLHYEGSWGLDVGTRVAAAIRGDEAPYCTGEDGARSLEVILAAAKSIETGRATKVQF